MKKIFPIYYCKICKDCKRRTWKSLFDTKSFLSCCDCNGIGTTTTFPFLIETINWCKLYKKK